MGKKRGEWNTREKKRIEKTNNPLVAVFRILEHYFKDFKQWIEELEDPRNQSYITYPQYILVLVAIIKNICSIVSMRSMSDNFNDQTCIENIALLSGEPQLSEIPHYDTINYYLERLSPDQLANIRTEMVRELIRTKAFNDSRLLGKDWRIILDGTGLFYFKEKHCDNCLREEHKTEEGNIQVRYYHKVLEAKLVLADNIVVSLDSEFIENEDENVTKQDCELNAAKRLLKRLKDAFPRLKICIQGDALYAAESIMKICTENGWTYLMTQKDTRQRLVGEAYSALTTLDKCKVQNIGAEKGTGYFYNHVEKLVDKKQVMNVIEYTFEKDGKNISMMWITNIKVTRTKLEKLIAAGRGRWKIENEGFNTQKNILYDIQHLNSRNYTAMKNHYLLTQIADIIMQLYLAWEKAHKTVMPTLKNMAAWILESLRCQTITDSDLAWIHKRTSIYLL